MHARCAQIEEGKDETEGGLLLTSASKEQPTIGKVRRHMAAAVHLGISTACPCDCSLS